MKRIAATMLTFVAALAPCTAAEVIPLEHLRSLNDQGRYRKAATAARERLELVEPRSGGRSLAVAETLDELVEALVRGGRAKDDEALQAAESALALKAELRGEHSAEYAASLFILARLQKSRGQYHLALETHRRALGIREDALGPDHPDVAMSLVYTGQLVFRLERAPEIARAMYDRAQEIFERDQGPRSRGVALVLRMKADLHIDAFEAERALELHRESLAMRAELLGPDHPDVGMNYNNIGLVLQQMGRYDESAAAKAEAVRIWERSLGPDHPLFAIALSNWSRMFWFGQVSPDQARAGLERVLAIQERGLGPDHPDLAPTLDQRTPWGPTTVRWPIVSTTWRSATSTSVTARAHFPCSNVPWRFASGRSAPTISDWWGC
jgi:tetratricopeptide (TPR) repeat protein